MKTVDCQSRADAAGCLPTSLGSCYFSVLLCKYQLPESAALCPGTSVDLEVCRDQHCYPREQSKSTAEWSCTVNTQLAHPGGKVYFTLFFQNFPEVLRSVTNSSGCLDMSVASDIATSPSFCVSPPFPLMFPAPTKQTTCTQVLLLSQNLVLGG